MAVFVEKSAKNAVFFDKNLPKVQIFFEYLLIIGKECDKIISIDRKCIRIPF
jgi:hypothetical protein